MKTPPKVLILHLLLVLFPLLTSCRYHLGADREESDEPKFREIADDLYDVFSFSGDKAWVIGYYGSIFVTEDAGTSWKNQPSGTTESLYAICFADPLKGWVCGSHGTLLATQDGGQTWARQESGTDKNLFSIQFLDPLHGMAAGYYGTLLRTQDGGRSWQDISLEEDVSLNAMDLVDDSQGWVVGEFSTVLHTQDFGTTWTPHKIPVEEATLFGVDFSSTTEGYVTGIDGIILKTNDGGSSWVRQESHSTDSIFSIQIAGDEVWAVGLKGTALRSNRFSTDWQLIPDVKGVWSCLRAVHSSGPKGGWIVGSKGTILRTLDDGTWQKIVF